LIGREDRAINQSLTHPYIHSYHPTTFNPQNEETNISEVERSFLA